MRRAWVAVVALAAVVSLAGAGTASPRKIELTVILNEFSFSPKAITVALGKKVEITLVNRGKQPHEFMVYTMPKAGMNVREIHDWAEENPAFKDLEVEVEVAGVEVVAKQLLEIEIPAGGKASLTFTPDKKGTFEIGCMIAGHYEQGMKGTLTVK